MEQPLQVTFRNIESSETILNKIRTRVKWLEHFCSRIISCRVVIEVPHRHHHTGNFYQVRIVLRVPGDTIAISRAPTGHAPSKALRIVIHEAFDEARRELADYVRRRRVEIKQNSSPPHAYVVSLVDGEVGYGFIRTQDGRDLYFHEKSVLNNQYRYLKVGTEVRYSEEMGENGPQASTLEVIGKNRRQFQQAS